MPDIIMQAGKMRNLKTVMPLVKNASPTGGLPKRAI